MAQNLKRAHHTVPKTLLKGFCGQSGVLRTRRRDGREFSISIEKASVHRDFYSFPDLHGDLVDAVEDWLDTGVEALAAPVLARAREGGMPSLADVPPLARFAAAGLLRTATVRSYLRQIDEASAPLALAMEVAKKRGINLVEMAEVDRKEFLATCEQAWSSASAPFDSSKSHLRTFLRKLDEISHRLAGWHWTLLTTADPCLITGDAPVATFATTDEGWSGILPPGSPVLLPVTSRSVLVGDEHRLGCGRLTDELAKLINTGMAREAFGAVFSDPSMAWPAYLYLAPEPPALPVPTVTWSVPRQAEGPVIPTGYPPIVDGGIQQLLMTLGAGDANE